MRRLAIWFLSITVLISIVMAGVSVDRVYAAGDDLRDDTFLTVYDNGDGTYAVYAYTAMNHGVQDQGVYYPPTIEASKTGDYRIEIAPEFEILTVKQELPLQSTVASLSYTGNTVSWHPDYTEEPSFSPFMITPINVIRITIKPVVTGTGNLTIANLFNINVARCVWDFTGPVPIERRDDGNDDVDSNIELTGISISDNKTPSISSYFSEVQDTTTPITTTSSESVAFVSVIRNETGIPVNYQASINLSDVTINGVGVTSSLQTGSNLDLSSYQNAPVITVTGKAQIPTGNIFLSSVGTYSYSTLTWSIKSLTQIDGLTVEMDVTKPQTIERADILNPLAWPTQNDPHVYSALNVSTLNRADPITSTAEISVALITPTLTPTPTATPTVTSAPPPTLTVTPTSTSTPTGAVKSATVKTGETNNAFWLFGTLSLAFGVVLLRLRKRVR